MRTPIILQHMLAPGDVTVMTALARDIALTYPDKYDVYTLTSCPSIWENNPHIAGAITAPMPNTPVYTLDYQPYIAKANYVPLHFITAFHREFEKMTGIHVPVLEPKPDLYLSQQERDEPILDGRYWLMFAGGKDDATVKIWSATFCQQVVNGLKECGISVVQTGGTFRGHWHPALNGVVNVVGKAGIRDTLRLIHHADGVMCPITWGMHAAAALERPCVVWAGGREHWWWEAYVNAPPVQNFGPVASGNVRVPHHYLHTQDLLSCCMGRGCWKNKVDPRQADKQGYYCAQPEDDGYGQLVPKCLKMITPEHVIQAVLSYYEEGMLPPIGKKPQITLPSGQPLDVTKPVTTTTALPQVTGTMTGQSSFITGTNAKGERIKIEDPMDHAVIGGKLTICTYLRGSNEELQKRCLNRIFQTVPRHRRELRVATDQDRDWLCKSKHDGYIDELSNVPPGFPKYQAMRKLFRQGADGLQTNYVVWFDQDAIADKDPQWWSKLAQTLIAFHPQGRRLYGPSMIMEPTPSQLEWLKNRPWWQSRNLRHRNGVEAADGTHIHYVHGGFFAVCVDTLRQTDLPDVELRDVAGDWISGAQIWQAGYDLKHWNGQKQFVTFDTDPHKTDEPEPGHAGWSPYTM